MDRRQFLSTLPALAVMSSASRSEEAKPSDLRVGAQSYTFRAFNLEGALSRMQKLGLKYGEFYQRHCPLTADEKVIKSFLKQCADFGVTPWSWGVQRFTKDHAENKKAFDFAKALGLKMISADPTPDSFDSLDKLCDEYKVAIGIHPHGPEGKGLHRWYSAEVILEAVKDRHELIGSCLDTGHLIRSAQRGKKLDPAAQIKLMGKRNFGIHLKDHDNEKKVDVVFGKGVLDVPAVLKALVEVKFNGLIAIEYEANEKEPTDDVRACLKVVEEARK
jgi:sugar phosphate isomerase/epimerase